MNERDGFIAAIKAEPADDTRRLAYADWLDEYGQHDRDRATAEFIRMSCTDVITGKVRKSLDRQVGKWLSERKYMGDMWGQGPMGMGRLIPALAQHIDRENKEYGEKTGYTATTFQREGRWLRFRRRRTYYVMSFELEYWRGFVRRVVFHFENDVDDILPLLIPDQPLCEPEMGLCGGKKDAKKSFVWAGYLGLPTWRNLLALPPPWKPDSVVEWGGANHRAGWEDWETKPEYPPHAKRMRWALCMAMHAAAKEIIDGLREPGQANLHALPPDVPPDRNPFEALRA